MKNDGNILTYADLFNARQQWVQFKELGFPPVIYVKKIHPIIKEVDNITAPMMEMFGKLMRKHGEETRPGVFVLKTDAAAMKFSKEFNPLLEESVDLDLNPLTLEDIAQADGALSGNMVSALWFLFEEMDAPIKMHPSGDDGTG